jgi:demethylmenaquinone methyltransferase/2-methoxy-6-polyprenyl-1,4-benzoquinol methylase
MSTYIFMKILESAPHRYDAGIRILTLGQIDTVYDRLISHIKKGQTVLDIGCGTGALAVRAAKKGAHVKGIDVNPHMLERAQMKADDLNLTTVTFLEGGVAELGGEEPDTYDVVMSGLCFSELSEDELVYTLRETKRILKPGGLLLVADEVKPAHKLKNILTWVIRVPLAVITYIATQTTTNPVKLLPEKIVKAGYTLDSIRLYNMETFIELVARKEE